MYNKINIPKNIKEALTLLNSNNHEGYIVGGCVRDFLLNKEPNDWDITSSASPDEVLKVFEKYKTIETGLQHGTVTVLINREPIEITTYRVDGDYSDGRRPDSVNFTKSLKEDLNRRDFTINAIAYNPKDGFVDKFNGIEDLNSGIIRCVGNADERFKEDSLRILRGIRFASKYGFEVEPETKEAMFNNKNLLKNVSQERITEEFIKTLKGKDCVKVLKEYEDIISEIIPEVKDMINLDQKNPHHLYTVWDHTLKSIENVPNDDIEMKLAMFFHDIGKPNTFTIDDKGIGHFKGHTDVSKKITDDLFKRMKLTNAEGIDRGMLNNVQYLVKNHDLNVPKNERDMNKTIIKHFNGNPELFRKILDVKQYDISAQSNFLYEEKMSAIKKAIEIYDTINEKGFCTKINDLKIDGNDLIKIGFKTGKDLGNTLNNLLLDAASGNISNERSVLLKSSIKRLDKLSKITADDFLNMTKKDDVEIFEGYINAFPKLEIDYYKVSEIAYKKEMTKVGDFLINNENPINPAYVIYGISKGDLENKSNLIETVINVSKEHNIILDKRVIERTINELGDEGLKLENILNKCLKINDKDIEL